ncbi:hypothetical protein Rhe02_18240 [Rhizocola hellebori]|uniref:RNA polymerase sigma factor n=1 Tax=Rhizocola hellebori TaxID=1392758 RepID=A0A8J3Q5P2_9ACTN|nr:sigma-70 family RNA polymerase sigma factor [Rhizocola hellebori]GIH03757.1 hypothetical protein Rhe02_18240 [Rhizocola hellebori]
MSTSFETFYVGTSGRLVRYAYGLTADMSEAQDLAQEAYARAWQRWPKVQGYDDPESWLRLVVSRLAVDRWRWLTVRRTKTPSQPETVAGPEDGLTHLIADLKRLPIQQRRALALHYLLDRSIADIAAELGTNQNTVKTWLSRGRANLAVLLGEPDAPRTGLREVAARAKRRRLNNALRTVAAFLGLGTAVAVAVALFGPIPQLPPVTPELVLEYPASPRTASVRADGDRAYLVSHEFTGQAWLAAIDLTSNRPLWSWTDLGNHDDSVNIIGVTDAAVLVTGADDSDSQTSTVMAVDPASGAIKWQRAADDLYATMAAGDVLISTAGGLSRVDAGTGKTKWTIAEPPGTTGIALPETLLRITPEHVLRQHDLATGRILLERSDLGAVTAPVIQIGEYAYLRSDDSVLRLQLRAATTPVKVAEVSYAMVSGCDAYVCVSGGDGVLIVLDASTGHELWRKKLARSSIATAVSGRILVTGDDSASLFDAAGNDITPAAMHGKQAIWYGPDHLTLLKQLPRPAPADYNGETLFDAEVSVYSFRTGQQQNLGSITMRGFCDGPPGKYVCPTRDGFTVFHH